MVKPFEEIMGTWTEEDVQGATVREILEYTDMYYEHTGAVHLRESFPTVENFAFVVDFVDDLRQFAFDENLRWTEPNLLFHNNGSSMILHWTGEKTELEVQLIRLAYPLLPHFSRLTLRNNPNSDATLVSTDSLTTLLTEVKAQYRAAKHIEGVR